MDLKKLFRNCRRIWQLNNILFINMFCMHFDVRRGGGSSGVLVSDPRQPSLPHLMLQWKLSILENSNFF